MVVKANLSLYVLLSLQRQVHATQGNHLGNHVLVDTNLGTLTSET
jgi:hypothetical protein